MKTRKKLPIILIIVVLIVAVSFAVIKTKEMQRTYYNQELARLVYEYWEIEYQENARIGEKTAKLLLPRIISSDPNLFQGSRFYFRFDDFQKTGKYIDLLLTSEEGTVFNPFDIGYNVFKLPSNVIKYKWCDFNLDYFGADNYSQYEKLKAKEEKKIKEKSDRILKIAEESFRNSLISYRVRKEQEEEFIKESKKLGSKQLQTNTVLDKQIKIIKKSTRTFKGYYSFAISSERFEQINCLFFYDPDPDFKIVQIELVESSKRRYFDIDYRIDYNKDCVWGYINNREATLDSFSLLSEILDLIETKITENPGIIRTALIAKSTN